MPFRRAATVITGIFFTLIIASRRSLDVLNHATQEINPHGSPYFNVFTEIRLGSLPDKHAQTLDRDPATPVAVAVIRRPGAPFVGTPAQVERELGLHQIAQPLLETAAEVLNQR